MGCQVVVVNPDAPLLEVRDLRLTDVMGRARHNPNEIGAAAVLSTVLLTDPWGAKGTGSPSFDDSGRVAPPQADTPA